MSNLSPKPFSYMPIKVTVVDRVTIGNQRYRLSRHHAGQVVVETIEEMPRFESFTELEFYEKHACGEIKIEENYFSQHRKTPDVHPGWLFTDYSPKKQAKALFYEQLIQAYENLSAKEGGLKRTVDELGPRMASLALEALGIVGKMRNGGGLVQLQRPPSVGHFNKMYRLFKESGGRTISLISKDEGPKRTYRIDPESLAVWDIDEFQHAMRSNTENQIKEIQDAMKALIQISADWPVQLILSGTPVIAGFRDTNPELSGRTLPFDLESLDPVADGPVIEKVVHGIITKHAQLEMADLDDKEFVMRLSKAANNQFGNVIQTVRLACEEVILAGGNQVGMSDFAKVYSMLVGSRNMERNLFAAPAWRDVQLPDRIANGRAFTALKKKREKTFTVRNKKLVEA